MNDDTPPQSNLGPILATIATSLVGVATKLACHVYKQKLRIPEQNIFVSRFCEVLQQMPKYQTIWNRVKSLF